MKRRPALRELSREHHGALVLALRITRAGDATAAARVDRVPASPELGPLLQRGLAGIADACERREFGRLWQDRVRRLLLEHGEDPAVFVVRESR